LKLETNLILKHTKFLLTNHEYLTTTVIKSRQH